MGDFESAEVEGLALQYLGTIPASKRAEPIGRTMNPLPPRTAEPEKRFIEVRSTHIQVLSAIPSYLRALVAASLRTS